MLQQTVDMAGQPFTSVVGQGGKVFKVITMTKPRPATPPSSAPTVPKTANPVTLTILQSKTSIATKPAATGNPSSLPTPATSAPTATSSPDAVMSLDSVDLVEPMRTLPISDDKDVIKPAAPDIPAPKVIQSHSPPLSAVHTRTVVKAC